MDEYLVKVDQLVQKLADASGVPVELLRSTMPTELPGAARYAVAYQRAYERLAPAFQAMAADALRWEDHA